MTRRFLWSRSAGRRASGFALGRLSVGLVALAAAGCGMTAWRPAREPGTQMSRLAETSAVAGECSLAAPGRSASPLATVGHVGMITAAEEAAGAAPKIEIYGGVSLSQIGDGTAGHTGQGGTPQYEPVRWDQAFDEGFGIDVQFVLKRPPRGARELAAGDTFLIARGMIDSYSGLFAQYAPGGAGTYDDMTLIGGWVEGRTVLNPLDAAGTLRPYFQYGGGVVRYPDVTVSGLATWEASIALGWRIAAGLELRAGKLGLYLEGGVRSVGPPSVDSDIENTLAEPDAVDMRTAQNLLTFPVRVGVMLGF